MFTGLLKNIKATDEQLDEEIRIVRSGSAPNERASVPVVLGLHYPPGLLMRPPIWKFSKPCTSGIFMKVSSCRHDHSLPPFPVHLSSLENGG